MGEVVQPLGRRVCLITMKELVNLGLVHQVITPLEKNGLEVIVFDHAQPEPTCADIDAMVLQVRAVQPDVIVAFGGGSVMDVAKAVAIGVTHSEPIWMYVNLSNRPPLPIEPSVLPVIAIPTTAGTGAEVTPYAVLSNEDTIQKGTIKSPYIFPKVAIVDPEITLALPRELTASTGIDAFAHATESYLNQANRTPFSDLVALESIQVISSALPRLMHKLDDLELRRQMAWGSMLAGLAIANAGTTVAHALAQPLGARTHLPHSVTVSIFTVPVLRHTWEADIDRFAQLCMAMDPCAGKGGTRAQQAEQGVILAEKLLLDTGMNHRLRHFSVSEEVKSQVLEDVFSYMNRPLGQHPKQFTREEIRTIIEEAA